MKQSALVYCESEFGDVDSEVAMLFLNFSITTRHFPEAKVSIIAATGAGAIPFFGEGECYEI